MHPISSSGTVISWVCCELGPLPCPERTDNAAGFRRPFLRGFAWLIALIGRLTFPSWAGLTAWLAATKAVCWGWKSAVGRLGMAPEPGIPATVTAFSGVYGTVTPFGGDSDMMMQMLLIHWMTASQPPDIVTARSVELGSISLATCMEAPVTSLISLILEPPLPISEPHCEAGTTSRKVIGGLGTVPGDMRLLRSWWH